MTETKPPVERPLLAALAQLQAGGPILIGRDEQAAGGSRHRYSTMAAVLQAVLPRLTECGLLLQERSSVDVGMLTVEAWLTHVASGVDGPRTQLECLVERSRVMSRAIADRVADEAPATTGRGAPPDVAKAIRDAVAHEERAERQGLGGALTYLRRYAILAAVGAASADDDAVIEAGPAAPSMATLPAAPRRMAQPPSQPQPTLHESAVRAALALACERLHGGDVDATVLAHLAPHGLTTARDATQDQARAIVGAIEAALATSGGAR